jgi:hypothetical protein
VCPPLPRPASIHPPAACRSLWKRRRREEEVEVEEEEEEGEELFRVSSMSCQSVSQSVTSES